MHGQFVWYELSTPDVEAAKKFYPRFTGWGTQSFDANYMMFTHGGAPIAGIFRLTDEMRSKGIPPNWMPYVEVSDVDASAAKATSLGATVTAGPDDIPGTGRFAVIQDPQGAVFGMYKSSQQSGAWDGTNEVGRFSWHELMTTDHTTAAAFYKSLFGWEKIGEMDMGGGAMYYMYGQNGKMYGGMFSMNEEWGGMHPFWLVYIHVKDVGKAVEIATKNGGSVKRPQMDIPGGSIAILGDPQGAGFALHHASAAEAPTAAAKVKAATAAVVTVVKKVVKKAVKKVVKKTVKKVGKKAGKVKKTKAPARKPAKAKARVKAKPKAAARKKTAAKSKPRRAARKRK